MINAGKLEKKITLLTLGAVTGGWAWQETGTAWAAITMTGKPALFSSVGLSARGAEITLRVRSLTLDRAVRYRGQHYFLTAADEDGKGFLKLTAATVEVVQCTATPDAEPVGAMFPGVLTEKYLRHEQQTPMAVNVICYVLVTPKAVELTPGELVDVAGTSYEILVAHTLDGYKNEYEIMRTVDK